MNDESELRRLAGRVEEAQHAIRMHVVQTEVRRVEWLRSVGAPTVRLMTENHQVSGSFKIRGALNAIRHLPRGSTVVAPSAGNHALAVVEACRIFDCEPVVVVPETASELKVQRLTAMTRVRVLRAGGTVEAAKLAAVEWAGRFGACYVDPFDNVDVIIGQATAAFQFLRDCPDVSRLYVGVGGGGLFAGSLLATVALDHPARVVGCEPAMYASFASALTGVRHWGPQPTFADGLATGVLPDAATVRIIRAAGQRADLVEVSEGAIAAAASALLSRESLLVEGAGAVPLAAVLGNSDLPPIDSDGSVGVIVSGGNVAAETLRRMLAFPQRDPVLARVADIYGRAVEDEPWVEMPSGAIADSRHVTSASDLFMNLLEGLSATLDVNTERLSQYEEHARQHELLVDLESTTIARALNAQLDGLLAKQPPKGLHEQRYRFAAYMAQAVTQAFEWRSPSYDQSESVNAFDLTALRSGGVNYQRYSQPRLAELEAHMAAILEVPTTHYDVVLTSSGMAAFWLAWMASGAARPSNRRVAASAPYVYFESIEAVELAGASVHRVNHLVASDLWESAIEEQADVLLVDPLENTSRQRLVDVESIFQLAEKTAKAGHAHPSLIVDGTMLPGLLSARLPTVGDLPVYYYESASKYLQLGMDFGMLGVAVVPKAASTRARRLRRVLGLQPDNTTVRLFPQVSPADMRERFARMEKSAERAATAARRLLGDELGRIIVHPSLADHEDFELTRRRRRGGACVTVHAPGGTWSNPDLHALVDRCVWHARRGHIPLVNGVSFGFTTSRISASSAMAEGQPPFLRLSLGDSESHAAAVGECLARAILELP